MIEFRNVSMTYKTGIQALNNVSFKVENGEFVFIIGLSGSGKSTLVKLLTCEENPSAGMVLIDEYEISYLRRSLIPYLRRNIGMVFQDFRLIYSKTVYENVAFAMEIVGASPKLIKRRVPIVLSIVGLRDKASTKTNHLSGGEQQRVAIARAMVNNPMLILADEPTGNLDPVNSESIMALLEEINCSGTTVIVCTHESGIVNKMRRRVIEISDGTLVRDEMLGEYNLANSKTPQKRKSKGTKKRTRRAEDLSGTGLGDPKAPFVRNINIKFSTEDSAIEESDSATVDAASAAADESSPEGSVIEESGGATVDAASATADESRPEETVNSDDSVKSETPSFHSDEEILSAVSKYYQEKAKDIKTTIVDLKTENVTDLTKEVDFRVLIKPKRVGQSVSPEDMK